jgi:signal transduction histidine kinase
MERTQVLLEVAGGTAHELSQPLASAQILADQLARQNSPASPEQIQQLRSFLGQTAQIIHQIQHLQGYVTKPYANGQILDILNSSAPASPQSPR